MLLLLIVGSQVILPCWILDESNETAPNLNKIRSKSGWVRGRKSVGGSGLVLEPNRRTAAFGGSLKTDTSPCMRAWMTKVLIEYRLAHRIMEPNIISISQAIYNAIDQYKNPYGFNWAQIYDCVEQCKHTHAHTRAIHYTIDINKISFLWQFSPIILQYKYFYMVYFSISLTIFRIFGMCARKLCFFHAYIKVDEWICYSHSINRARDINVSIP